MATHISLLAAPIYAVFLGRHLHGVVSLPPEELEKLRGAAITQAQALWLQTLGTPDRRP